MAEYIFLKSLICIVFIYIVFISKRNSEDRSSIEEALDQIVNSEEVVQTSEQNSTTTDIPEEEEEIINPFTKPPEKFIMPESCSRTDENNTYPCKFTELHTITFDVFVDKNIPKNYCPELSSDFHRISLSDRENNNNNEKLLMIGILTIESACYRRQILRSTVLNTNKFSYRFLVDRPTPEILNENATYQDIISLDTQYTGRAYKFGEKFYNWIKYANLHFWDYTFIAKADDDVYFCEDNLVNDLRGLVNSEQIDSIKYPGSNSLYYGWLWIGENPYPNTGTKWEMDLQNNTFNDCTRLHYGHTCIRGYGRSPAPQAPQAF